MSLSLFIFSCSPFGESIFNFASKEITLLDIFAQEYQTKLKENNFSNEMASQLSDIKQIDTFDKTTPQKITFFGKNLFGLEKSINKNSSTDVSSRVLKKFLFNIQTHSTSLTVNQKQKAQELAIQAALQSYLSRTATSDPESARDDLKEVIQNAILALEQAASETSGEFKNLISILTQTLLNQADELEPTARNEFLADIINGIITGSNDFKTSYNDTAEISSSSLVIEILTTTFEQVLAHFQSLSSTERLELIQHLIKESTAHILNHANLSANTKKTLLKDFIKSIESSIFSSTLTTPAKQELIETIVEEVISTIQIEEPTQIAEFSPIVIDATLDVLDGYPTTITQPLIESTLTLVGPTLPIPMDSTVNAELIKNIIRSSVATALAVTAPTGATAEELLDLKEQALQAAVSQALIAIQNLPGVVMPGDLNTLLPFVISETLLLVKSDDGNAAAYSANELALFSGVAAGVNQGLSSIAGINAGQIETYRTTIIEALFSEISTSSDKSLVAKELAQGFIESLAESKQQGTDTLLTDNEKISESNVLLELIITQTAQEISPATNFAEFSTTIKSITQAAALETDNLELQTPTNQTEILKNIVAATLEALLTPGIQTLNLTTTQVAQIAKDAMIGVISGDQSFSSSEAEQITSSSVIKTIQLFPSNNNEIISQITAGAIEGLGMINDHLANPLSETDKIAAISSIVHGAVASTELSYPPVDPTSTTNLAARLNQITETAVGSIDATGIATPANLQSAIAQVSSSAISALITTAVTPTQLVTLVQNIIDGTVSGIDAAITSTPEMIKTIELVTETAVQAVEQILPTNNNSVIAAISIGMMTGLPDVPVNDTVKVEIIKNATENIVAEALLANPVTDATSLTSMNDLIAAISAETTALVDTIGITDPSLLPQAIAAVSDGAVAAITSSTLTNTEKSQFISTTVDSTINTIDQVTGINLATETSPIIAAITESAVETVIENQPTNNSTLISSVVVGANLGAGNLALDNSNVESQLGNLQTTITNASNQGLQDSGISGPALTQQQQDNQTAVNTQIPDCPNNLTAAANGLLNAPSVKFGAVATYSCNSGYQLSSIATRTCQVDGSWNNSAPLCNPVSCGTPNLIANSTIGAGASNYLDTRTVGCDPGFHIIGSNASSTNSVISCQADANWSATSCTDQTAPILTGLSNDGTPRTSKTWNWNCTDISGACTYQYAINQNAVHVFSTEPWVGSLTDNQPSGNGTFYLHIRAQDSAGNTSTQSDVSTILNNTAPTISTGSPSISLANISSTITTTITYTGADNISLSNGDIIFSGASAGCSANVTGSGSTTRTVEITNCSGNGSMQFTIAANSATNNAGVQALVSTSSTAVTIDNTAPVITGVSNDPTAVTAKTWNWGCTESNGPCAYRFIVDASPTYSFSAEAFDSTTTASQNSGTSTYYLHLEAKDAIGNISTTSHISAVLNNTAPSISFSAPSVSFAKAADTFTYTVTYTGANNITLANGDINFAGASTGCSAIVSGTGSTTRTVSITGCSGNGSAQISIAGNSATNPASVQAPASGVSSSIIIDNTLPVISGISDDLTPATSKSWTWGCADANSCTYRFVVDTNTTYNFTNETYSATTTTSQATGSNTYYLHVQAIDAAGNIGAPTNVSTIINNTAPTISIGGPSVSLASLSTNINYTVTYTGADNITLANGDIIFAGASSGCSALVSGSGTTTRTVAVSGCSGNGNMQFTIAANSATNNAGVQALVSTASGGSGTSAAVAIDNTAPVLTGLSNDVSPNQTKTWNWGCTETNGPCTYRYLVDTSPTYNFTNEVFNVDTTTTQSSGTNNYYLHIQAIDAIGNISTTTNVTAILDNTAPSTHSVSIASAATYTNANPVSLTLAASDNIAPNEMYITNTAGCSAGGSWEAYSTSKASWTFGQTNATATVYAKFRDAALNESTCVNDTIIHDNTPATISSVTPPANAIYGVSTNLDFVVNFSKSVTITNAPRLTLTVGGSTRYANYLSGSGSSALTFRYSVAVSENDTDGIALATSVDLNTTGTIRDAATNNATLTLSAPNLTSVFVDTSAPSIHSVSIVSAATYTNANPVPLTLAASDNIALTEMYITNTAGCSAGGSWETYSTSKASWTLGQTNSTATVYAKFRDAALNESTCVNDTIVHDNTATTIASVTAPANASYALNGNLDFIVNFSENVTVTSTPRLTLTVGGATRYANYLSGSGSTAVTFRYTVGASENDTDGIALATSVDLNTTGTIRDAATNDAALTLIVPNLSAVRVDTTAPTTHSVSIAAAATYTNTNPVPLTLAASDNIAPTEMYITNTAGCSAGGSWEAYSTSKASWTLGQTNATATVYTKFRDAALNESTCVNDTIIHDNTAATISSVTPPANAIYALNGNLDFVVNFSENITVTNTPRLTLTVGGATRYANYLSGSGSAAVTFRYTVGASENDTDGIVLATSIDLNTAGMIRDVATNNATLTLAAPNLTAVRVDTAAPNTHSILIASGAANTDANPVPLTLAASDNIAPFEMYITNTAGCSAGGLWEAYSTSKASWTLGQTNATATVYIKFRDAALNESTCVNDTIIHDDTVITITSVIPPANSSYGLSSNLDFVVNFSRNVIVTNTPRLTLTVGGATRYANYLSGSGSSAVTFRYTVGAAENDSNGITMATSIDLNTTGTIQDVSTNNAILTLTAPNLTNVLVDAVAPNTHSVSIASAATYTTVNPVALALAASDNNAMTGMYITSTAGCAAGGSWEAYSTSKATWTLGQTNATATVYAKFRDAALNESTCVSDTIIHDNTAPTSTLSGTPTNPSNVLALDITVAGTDVVGYRYKMGSSLTTLCSLVGDYSSEILPAVKITDSLALFYDQTLRVCALGTDSAGNLQPGASATIFDWTKDTIAPYAELANLPTGTSSVLSLNVDVFGNSVAAYRYKVGEGGSTDCAISTGYSAEVLESVNIADSVSGLANGSIRICAVARDGLSNWQTFSAATQATWTKNTTAPAGLSYVSPTVTYFTGASIPRNLPNNANVGPFTYSVAPDLPTGLNINPTTGIISGIPSSISGGASYTVTATSAAGSITANVNITIVASTLTVVSPAEGETIPSYKVIRGLCQTGVSVTFTTSPGLTASSGTDPCTAGTYGVGLTSSDNYGPRWVKVEQNGITIVRNVYNANIGINNRSGIITTGTIKAVVRDLATGKVYIGSDMTTQFKDTNKKSSNLARLNIDGSIDSTFVQTGTGLNNRVDVIAVQPDGKVFIGGPFTSYDGTSRNRIARLNTNGTLDTSFVVGTGFNSVVAALALQSDGKIILGGNFSSYNGTARSNVARLNADGTLDTTFTLTGAGLNSAVTSIAVQSDGKIVVGGPFTSYNGTSRIQIARLNADGTLDTTFTQTGTGLNSSIITLAIQSNGKVIVGGVFTSYNGISRNRIARLNTDGTLDTSFVVGTGFNYDVNALIVQADGKVVVGGGFSSYNGSSRGYITRLNVDGTLDTSFVIGTGFSYYVYALAIQSDGKVVAGGQFTAYNSISRNYFARINADGTLDTTFVPTGTGLDSTVNTVAVQSDGKVVAGGAFTTYHGTPRNTVARLNADGTLDTTFAPTGTGFNSLVQTISLQSDGKIIVGGQFTSYNSIARKYIARLNADGTLDTTFAPTGTGLNTSVNTVAVQSDGKVIVGGQFTNYNSTNRYRIARLNADGTLDTTFAPTGTGFNSLVQTISLQSDGKIIVGGQFTNYNSTARNYIARLNADGTLDTGFVVGTGFSAAVNTLAVQSDGKVIVGGQFTTYNGTARNRIARLNTDGTLDTTFAETGTGLNGSIKSLVLQSDGKVIIGGQFGSYNGTARNRIARINSDGTLDVTFASTGTGPSLPVETLALKSDGKIWMGGGFITYYGFISPYLVGLDTDGSLYNNGLYLNPASIKLAVNATTTITPVNGTGPFTYSIMTGPGTINSSTGFYTAPTFAGTTTIKVTDSLGVSGYGSVSTYQNSILISPNSIDLTQNANYTLSVLGGLEPYQFTMISGSGSVNSSTGVFTAAAVNGTTVVRVTDQNGLSAEATINVQSGLSVSPAMQTLAPNSNLTFTASGGTSPYTYSILSGTGSVGSLSGVYTASVPSSTAVVRVTDSLGRTADALATISGTSSSLAVNPANLTIAASNTFSFSATGGQSPYTYSLTTGSGSISSAGLYTAAGGAGSATITVTDSLLATSIANITVNADLTLSTLTSISAGGNFTFSASGGVPPYAFSVQSGGGSIGAMSGAYTASSSLGTTTVVATDSFGNRASQSFRIVEALKLNIDSLAVQRLDQYQFTARGGSLPYTYSTTNGTINALTGIYSAPAAVGPAVVTVTDLTGQTATANISITPIELSNLNYNRSVFGLTLNALAPPMIPSYLGDAGTFAISPTLPTGLNFNTSTGIITGTPTVISGATIYTMTASNSGNVNPASTTISIQVFASNPFTVESPIEGETIPSYKVVRGVCLTGVVVSITTSVNLKASSNTDSCEAGTYAVGLTSLDDFGPSWVKVEQNGIAILRNVYNANIGGNNNSGVAIVTGLSGVIKAVAVDPVSGKTYAGGNFMTQFKDTHKRSSYLARLNTDGTFDTSFAQSGEGLNGKVDSIAIQSDGKVIVGGQFTSYNGTARNYFARLNTDGTLDTSFVVGTGFSSFYIYEIVIQSDSKIMVSGSFSSYNGTTANNIARLNADGTFDTTFVPTGSGINASINDIAVQSNGKYIVVGSFTSYNGTSRINVARLNTDGTLDTTFVPTGTSFDYGGVAVAVQSDDKVIVGGQFGTYNGTTRSYIARLNTDGTLDTTFAQTGSGLTGVGIFDLKVQSDGKVIVGGWLSGYNGTARNCIARINTNGTLDTTFAPTGSGISSIIWRLTVQSDGKVVVGGQFTSYNGTTRLNIARLNTNGTLDTAFALPVRTFNSTVHGMAVQSDGKVIVGGEFTSYNGTASMYIARLNVDKTLDTTFALAGSGLNNKVQSIAVQSDGKVIIGGDFSSYNGTARNYIARLNADGTLDTTFVLTGTGLNNSANVILVQSDGKVIIGGGFSSYNGTTRNRIARLNADGSLDTTFAPTGTGLNALVHAVSIQSDGKIMIGGEFTSYNGTVQNKITRLNSDGTLDTTFAPTGTGISNHVYTLAVQSDGNILVGGQFGHYNGTVRNFIVRLNADGTLNPTFALGTGFNSAVKALTVLSGGKIFARGDFLSYNGITNPYIVGLDADGSLSSAGLSLAPAHKKLPVSTTVSIAASGGATPYVYSIFSGSGSINSSTGLFTASSSAGESIVLVTDFNGVTAKAAITTYAALSVSQTSSSIYVGNAVTLTPSGGVAPFTYQIIEGRGSVDTVGYYIAPAWPGTAVIRTTDSAGNFFDSTITVNNY